MSTGTNSFIEYNTVSIEDSNADDIIGLDESEDVVEYMDGAYLIKTLITEQSTEVNSTTHQHHTDRLSSSEDLEKLDEISQNTNTIAGTSLATKANGTSNNFQEVYISMTTKENIISNSLPSEGIKADKEVEVSDDTNTIAETSITTKGNRISNNSQVDNIDVSSSKDITNEPTCTADSNVIVVAIDFGTTYSGWTFSFRKKFQDNKLDIEANNGWKSGDGLITPKVPTCILFDKNEKFHSFGYEAESTYAELLEYPEYNKAEG